MKPFAPWLLVALAAANLTAAEPSPTPSATPALAASPAPAATPADSGSLIGPLGGHVPPSITGNPVADDVSPGTGLLGHLLHVPDDLGLRLGGLWLGDTNTVLGGGSNPGRWLDDSLLIVGATLDAEKLIGWKGASFGIQFLQFNGGSVTGKTGNVLNANGLAGSVQGYNSLPGSTPLNRSELYQLWYRQSFLNDRLVFRIGKQVPTYDFNNVTRPVATSDDLAIPSVTGLLFTPVFVNPTLLGAIGGYYNSVSGVSVAIAPTKNTYLRYGFYDGNVANGAQTGMTGPEFNSYTFNIWEAGMTWVLADKYPGNFGAGLWYQSGLLSGPNGITQNGTGGYYMFGSQRLWSNADWAPKATTSLSDDGKSKVVVPAQGYFQKASISAFAQYGYNNSTTLPMNQSFGMGLTGFGLVPFRPGDSLGVGMSWAWLNPNIFNRSSELMFQGYYQAHLIGATFFQPAITYIPTPGASSSLGGAWALTLRIAVLF